ncbi:MAG: hypothetical protein H6624_05860 [Bdellovibrionaceae bacterium]|nr:hypothetical protein [Bdellovibrionales bacterium]MCB9083847.1 hypothetical protein [Pseudobdellovibrionaceae bacterium]
MKRLVTIYILFALGGVAQGAEPPKTFYVLEKGTSNVQLVVEQEDGSWGKTGKLESLGALAGRTRTPVNKSQHTKSIKCHREVCAGHYFKSTTGVLWKALAVFPDGSIYAWHPDSGRKVVGSYEAVQVVQTMDCPEKGRPFHRADLEHSSETIEAIKGQSGDYQLNIYNNGPLSKPKYAIGADCLSNGQVVVEYHSNSGYMGASLIPHADVLDRDDGSQWRAFDDYVHVNDNCQSCKTKHYQYQAGSARPKNDVLTGGGSVGDKVQVLKERTAPPWTPTGPIKGGQGAQ